MTTELPPFAAELEEMTNAVEKVITLFQKRCPEGFYANDLAEAIVDVCSDEMYDLYRARAERDKLRDGARNAAALLRDIAKRSRLNQSVNPDTAIRAADALMRLSTPTA